MPILSNFPSGGAKKTILQILKEKIIPTKAEQTFVPDEGYDGYGEFVVGAIPDEYQDTSSVTATAEGTLTGTSFVDAAGNLVDGVMNDNGDVSSTFDGIDVKAVEIPEGYTTGGTVGLTDDIDNEVTAQEDLLAQVVAALEGKAGGGIDTSDANASSEDMREGASGYVNGVKVEGSVPTRSEADVSVADGTIGIPAGIYDESIEISTEIPAGYVKPTGIIDITSNGTHTVTNYASANVNVPIPEGYADVSGVTATAADVLASETIVLSDGTPATGTIPTKTSGNLTVSGATVSVPAGYYASAASKSVSTATQATPSITVSSSGLITASATQSAGYVSSGTKSATNQLTTQAAKTVTPSTSSQTAVASGRYTTGAVTVAGDSNLVASNIKSGVSIFGVAGSYEGSSGGSSLGSPVSNVRSSEYVITFNVSNASKIVAFFVLIDGDSIGTNDGNNWYYTSLFYDKNAGKTTYQAVRYDSGCVFVGADTYVTGVTFGSSSITIEFSYMFLANTIYTLYPIYSE